MGEVPQIGQIAVHFDEIADLRIGETQLANHFIERKPQGDAARTADRVLGIRHQFAHQP